MRLSVSGLDLRFTFLIRQAEEALRQQMLLEEEKRRAEEEEMKREEEEKGRFLAGQSLA